MPELINALKTIAPAKPEQSRRRRSRPGRLCRSHRWQPTIVGANEGAHHEDFAVGEVDQLDDAVDERIAERDQGDQGAVGEPE